MTAKLAPGHSVGIDRPLIGLVVRAFYQRVRQDPLLGPIFDARIHDWVAHEALLTRFWSSMLLTSGEYHGAPLRVHIDLPDVERAHFDRWLALFADALSAVCTPEQAALFMERANRIAQAFLTARASTRPCQAPLRMS